MGSCHPQDSNGIRPCPFPVTFSQRAAIAGGHPAHRSFVDPVRDSQTTNWLPVRTCDEQVTYSKCRHVMAFVKGQYI